MSPNGHQTLVVDVSMRPSAIVSWQRAMSLISLGLVESIRDYDGVQIHTPHAAFPLPAVVRWIRSVRMTKRSIRFSRINIHERDGYRCQYCLQRFSTEDLTLDHVLPRSQGGKTVWENIVASCYACNSRKAGRTPEQAGMPLAKKPVRPRSLPIRIQPPAPGSWYPDEWASFLYWESTLEP